MLDLGQFALGQLLGVWQTAPDEVLDALLLASVDNVLALLELGVLVCGLPVVGDGEDAVRAGDGLLNAVKVVEVGLC